MCVQLPYPIAESNWPPCVIPRTLPTAALKNYDECQFEPPLDSRWSMRSIDRCSPPQASLGNWCRDAADRVVFMDGGLVVADTTPADFFEKSEIPRVRKFLNRVGMPTASWQNATMTAPVKFHSLQRRGTPIAQKPSPSALCEHGRAATRD